MKRLLEIFIFLLSIAYTDSLDTDVSHVIIDHKGNSIIALVDSMDLDNVYYTKKIDNKSSTIDIDKVYFIYNDFDRVYHYDWSYYENLRRITNRTSSISYPSQIFVIAPIVMVHTVKVVINEVNFIYINS